MRRLLRDRRGATVVEFALIAAPLIMTIMALTDLAFRAFMGVQLQGAMDQAARQVTVGGVTTQTVTTFVQGRMRTLLSSADVKVKPMSYDDFSTVGKPEPITTDTAPLGTYNKGDCFLDLNNNKQWDADGGAGGNGGGDDIIYYTATVSYPALMPLGRFLGFPDLTTITATMMMRNQPYEAQAQPVTVCT
ncbi:TadE/TadG family type IV pilus assembly protein [uncultured Sphingomonas sp.]|uniref:TadE/TadG family type IV pilus assembly protein n=1 Tax=uncultured Sphingomonas sp. TaxID=158754 RepID=UPI0025FA0B2A|nr:TadE/TadG family type IV pilus assembly protein [uncultured Sphingomonas sp.]